MSCADDEILRAAKDLLKDSKIAKVIHDCRMDTDALFHVYGIELNNIHDTSRYHAEIAGSEDKSLNGVLEYNGIQTNATRDKNVYTANPNFWATRPLTRQMIEWASSDVDRLIDVVEKQVERLGSLQINRAATRSQESVKFAREKEVTSGLVVTTNIERFIGQRGANLRSLQARTNTLIYQDRESGTWFVYHDMNSDGLERVQRAMRGV